MQVRTNEDRARIISRGRDAFRDYSLIEEKIKEYRAETLEVISKTKLNDDVGRRNLVISLQIADRVLEYLLSDIRDGKHAIEQMEEIKRVGRPTLLQRVMP